MSGGEVHVSFPISETVRAECLRDFKRTLSGRSVFIYRHRIKSPLLDSATDPGDVTKEACEAALRELQLRLQAELKANSCISEEELQTLSLRVASHISVAPGIQAVLSQRLPPALWQPSFVISICPGEVRVLTLAFVGDPVAGDRPSCKWTNKLLRLSTGNLLVEKACEEAGTPGPSTASFAVIQAKEGFKSIEEHLSYIEDIFATSSKAKQVVATNMTVTGLASKPARPETTPGRLNNQVQWWEDLSRKRASGSLDGLSSSKPADVLIQSELLKDKVASLRSMFSGGGLIQPGSYSQVQISDRQARMRSTFAAYAQSSSTRVGETSRAVSTPVRAATPVVDRQARMRMAFHRTQSPSQAPAPALAGSSPATPSRQVVDRAARMRASIRAQSAVASKSYPVQENLGLFATLRNSFEAMATQATVAA